MIPPVDVPAIRAKLRPIGRPVRGPVSAGTSAGIRPRMPPPSMASTRIVPAGYAARTRRDAASERGGLRGGVARLLADVALVGLLVGGDAEARRVARRALDDVVGRAVGDQPP